MSRLVKIKHKFTGKLSLLLTSDAYDDKIIFCMIFFVHVNIKWCIKHKKASSYIKSIVDHALISVDLIHIERILV